MPSFDQAKFALLNLKTGAYRNTLGGRVDVVDIGTPDSQGCSFMGTDRQGIRKFYRKDGTSPDAATLVALWPADEPDRYQIIQHNPDEDIYRVNPLQFADGSQLRESVPEAKWAILITRDPDAPGNPKIELIDLTPTIHPHLQ